MFGPDVAVNELAATAEPGHDWADGSRSGVTGY